MMMAITIRVPLLNHVALDMPPTAFAWHAVELVLLDTNEFWCNDGCCSLCGSRYVHRVKGGRFALVCPDGHPVTQNFSPAPYMSPAL